MDVPHAVIILLLILVVYYLFIHKKNSAEGLLIPNSAGPLSNREIIRLVKGGVPRVQDQYLGSVPKGSMAHLGTFNPDSPSEGFTVDSGTDVTSTDLQRQLFTGISAAEGYVVKSENQILRGKPDAYIIKPDGYVVKNQYAAQNATGPYRPRSS